MPELAAALEANLVALSLAALGLASVSLLVAVTAVRRVRRSGRDRGTAPITDEAALERRISWQDERIEALQRDLQRSVGKLGAVEEQASWAVQRAGLVRFNPFEDTGSNQSFSLALLDGRDDGFILSSLHSRQATRVYIKRVINGRSESALSSEESEALRQAREVGAR